MMNESMLSQASAEQVRAYGAIANAITATILNARAGLDWLDAQPPNLEEIRRSLNSIASEVERAADFIVRIRALMKNEHTIGGDLDPVGNAAQARPRRRADKLHNKPNLS